MDDENILGYLCIDFDGESAYQNLNGTWNTDENYVVVHRMAFTDDARGKGISTIVFHLVEELSRKMGVTSFRVDTDGDNKKMQHVWENADLNIEGQSGSIIVRKLRLIRE